MRATPLPWIHYRLRELEWRFFRFLFLRLSFWCFFIGAALSLANVKTISLILIVVTLSALWYYQSVIVYENWSNLSRCELVTRDVVGGQRHIIETEDGHVIELWVFNRAHSDRTARCATMLYFHGNAAGAGFSAPFARKMARDLNLTVVIGSYRGYGSGSGHPTELGLQKDAIAALQWITLHPNYGTLPLVVAGCSLGSAVATFVASRKNCKAVALVLESPFPSIRSMLVAFGAPRWLGHILTSEWPTDERLRKLEIPVLLFAATEDTVIPLSQTMALHHPPKTQLVIVDGVCHGQVGLLPVYRDKMQSLLDDTLPQCGR